MSWIKISSAGTIEPAALEILGATDKGKDQIGQFGSGIKFALIQALRNKVDIRIHSGFWTCEFDTKPVKIGTKTFERVVYKYNTTIKNAHVHESSFSLNAAAEWTEPWFILREFWANALDEDEYATMEVVDAITDSVPDRTDVYIALNGYIEDAFKNRGHWDARVGRTQISGLHPDSVKKHGNLYEADCCPGVHIYLKGFLIYHEKGGKEDSFFYYDINECEGLNEVRQLGDSWKVLDETSTIVDHLDEPSCRSLLKKFHTDFTTSPHNKLFEKHLRFRGEVNPKWSDLIGSLYTTPLIVRRTSYPSHVLARLESDGYEIVDWLPTGIHDRVARVLPTPHKVLSTDSFTDTKIGDMDQARIDKALFILRNTLVEKALPVLVVEGLGDEWEYLEDEIGHSKKAVQLGSGLLRQGTPAVITALLKARYTRYSSYGEGRDEALQAATIAALIEAHHHKTGEIIG